MNAQDFVSAFLSSEHGQNAASALGAQGVTPDVIQQVLTHGAEAGHAHAEEHGSGLLGEHPGRSFFAAFTAGLIKGDGLLGSIGDGLEGVLVGRIAEALADKVGMDPGTASTLAATATPYIAGFLKEKLAG